MYVNGLTTRCVNMLQSTYQNVGYRELCDLLNDTMYLQGCTLAVAYETVVSAAK